MKIVFTGVLMVVCIVLATGCKKDEVGPATVNFSPLSAGSTWTYEFKENTNSPETFTLTALSKDTSANNKSYKVLSVSNGTKNQYLAKSEANYYRLATFPAVGIENVEELYLKENETVNGTWSFNTSFVYLGSTVTATLTYTIKEKNITRTVKGKGYNNVVHVRSDISIQGGLIGGGDFYYADGVGLIENQILIQPPFGQSYTASQLLVSHNIK